MYIHSRYHYSPIVNNEVDIYLLIQKDVFNILSEKASYKQVCIDDTMGNRHTYKHTCTHTHNTSLEGRIISDFYYLVLVLIFLNFQNNGHIYSCYSQKQASKQT